jgi:hypothetical protein
MSTLVKKYGCNAAMLALVAWFAWGHATGPEPWMLECSAAKLPQIQQAALELEIPERLHRDPFVLAKSNRVDDKEKPAAPKPPAPDPRKVVAPILETLQLDATYVFGQRRLAVINGTICEPGERLVVASAADIPCIVRHVDRDQVQLEILGQAVTLRYGQSANVTPSRSPMRKVVAPDNANIGIPTGA